MYFLYKFIYLVNLGMPYSLNVCMFLNSIVMVF